MPAAAQVPVDGYDCSQLFFFCLYKFQFGFQGIALCHQYFKISARAALNRSLAVELEWDKATTCAGKGGLS